VKTLVLTCCSYVLGLCEALTVPMVLLDFQLHFFVLLRMLVLVNMLRE